MIVVPQRAQRFINVTVWLVGRVESGQHVGIMLIAEVPDLVKVAGVAVTLRRRKPIVIAHEDGRAIMGHVGRAGATDVMTVIERPDGLRGEAGITRLPHCYRLLGDFVKLLRWELVESLVVGGANLAGRCIWGFRVRGIERGNRLCDRHDRKWINEWRSDWAGWQASSRTQIWHSLLKLLTLSPGSSTQTTLG